MDNRRFCSKKCWYTFNTRSVEERFWAYVDKSGECWFWTAALSNGYGIFSAASGSDGSFRNHPAHRFAWELVNGPMAPELFACHSCDSRYPVGDISYRRCVRPDHIFPGTQLDNMRDAASKGRTARAGAKLTWDQVRAIRCRLAVGETPKVIARDYPVTASNIKMIRAEKTWREADHLPA